MEEIKALCSGSDEVEVVWVGNGAARVITTALPSKLVALRSIDYLCAYVKHALVDLVKFSLDDINDMVDPQKHAEFASVWADAFELWNLAFPACSIVPQLSPTTRPDTPGFTKRERTISYKVKGLRKGVKCKVSSMDGAARLGEIMFESFHDLEVSMKKFEMEVHFIMDCEQLLIAISLTPQRVSIRNRVVVGPSSLDAANAYALLKWANIQPGEVVFDPMAGAGTIPIEGSHLYPHSHFVISDLTPHNVDLSRQNVAACAGQGPLSIILADAQKLPLRPQCVDVVISDLPFGMRMGSVSANKSLYPALFKQMERFLRSGGRAVLLTMAKTVIKKVIEDRKRFGWTFVRERPLEVGGYRSWVFELSYEFLPLASNANRELVHKLTGQPRIRASVRAKMIAEANAEAEKKVEIGEVENGAQEKVEKE